MRAALILVCLIAAAALEAVLLRLTVFHPAYAPPTSTRKAPLFNSWRGRALPWSGAVLSLQEP